MLLLTQNTQTFSESYSTLLRFKLYQIQEMRIGLKSME